MKLFEHQAKELFEEHGIPVPVRVLISNVSELEQAILQIGLPCVLKAQVLQGGRGKAGLVKFVTTKEEAQAEAKRIIEITEKKLMVESAVNFEKEMYLAITMDPVAGKAMVMACMEGGVDIEDIARNTPEKIVREYVDLRLGLMTYQANNVMYALGLSGEAVKQGCNVVIKLYEVFKKYEAELVEINPLMITKEGQVIAADGKVSLDDNTLYKHQRYSISRDHYKSDFEYQAALDGIPYIQFDGDIGLMCAGAGLTNVIFDLINYGGGTVANYLEFGGPNYHKSKKCMEMMLETKPKAILIATFGTIARADVMAQGIAEAVRELKPTTPIVTCIRGTGEEEAIQMLKDVGLEPLADTEEAVKKVIKLAGGDSR